MCQPLLGRVFVLAICKCVASPFHCTHLQIAKTNTLPKSGRHNSLNFFFQKPYCSCIGDVKSLITIDNASLPSIPCTTLQSIKNGNLSLHRFLHFHENGLIKTIQTIAHNPYVSFKLASLYCGLRLILVYLLY